MVSELLAIRGLAVHATRGQTAGSAATAEKLIALNPKSGDNLFWAADVYASVPRRTHRNHLRGIRRKRKRRGATPPGLSGCSSKPKRSDISRWPTTASRFSTITISTFCAAAMILRRYWPKYRSGAIKVLKP